MSRKTDPCHGCGFLNEYGYCECSGYDKWYACPIENEKPANKRMWDVFMKEFVEKVGNKNESCD